MKKLFLSMLVMVCAFATASSQTFEVDGLTYNIYQSTVTIIKSAETISGDFVIPSQVTNPETGNTYTVVNIGSYQETWGANVGAFQNRTGLTSVVIPNTVTSIGGIAFWGCTGLKSISIPASVETIFDNPFSGCSALETITIDSNNPNYDSRDNCNAINTKKVIEVTSTFSYPKDQLVIGCNNSVIPNTVTSIGQEAFRGCSGLASVTFPASVVQINNRAFMDCSGLTSITIPATVEQLGENPFLGCYNIETMVVENGNGVYDSRNDCNAIIQKNGNTLVSGCKNTIIPNDVEKIGKSSFRGITTLQSIVIPEGVTAIDENAFTMSSYNNVLKSVTLPSTLTAIGSYAFSGCTALDDVYCYPAVTTEFGPFSPMGFDVWSEVNRDYPTNTHHCNLHVYSEYAEWYSNADQWKEFNVVGDLVHDAALYLYGVDGDWTAANAKAFTKDANGNWTLTQEMGKNVEFKLVDQDGGWYGAVADGDSYLITKEMVAGQGTPLDLTTPGKNFRLPVAGTWTLTVDPTLTKLTVTGEWTDHLYLMGSYNQWGDGRDMVQGEDGKWTITQAMQQGEEFKFIDHYGVWYGGVSGNNEITQDMVENGTALGMIAGDDGVNFVSPVFGEWTFTVDLDAMTFTVSGSWPQPVYDPLYVIGEVGELDYDKVDGLQMETTDGVVYTADVNFDGRHVEDGAEVNYFDFSTSLEGKSFDDLEEYRIGAVSEGDYWFDDDQLGERINLNLRTRGGQCIRISKGDYTLTVDMNAMNLVITKKTALLGDVNLDGKVDVTDVNIVVNIILGKDNAANYDGRADVNNSGAVDVSDVNAVVNILLGKGISEE